MTFRPSAGLPPIAAIAAARAEEQRLRMAIIRQGLGQQFFVRAAAAVSVDIQVVRQGLLPRPPA